MGAFLIFTLNRFIFRISEFIWHWYVVSFEIFAHITVSFLEKLDRFFAFKISLRHIFKPLYQDRSVIGYVLGFIFRLMRIILGGISYGIIIVAAAILFLGWAFIPLFIIFKALKSSPVAPILGINQFFN